MKKLIYYFFILLAAVWVGLKIAADPGYLLIAYQKNTVEMPLWLAVLGIIALFLLLYFTLRLISNIRSLGRRIRAWSRQRRIRQAWQRTHRGLIALAAGDWRLAEKDLLRAAPYTDTPIINYLAAARAAQAQKALTRRDEYLSKIHSKGRLSELALGLTQAHLQLHQHQYEQALATLQQLHHLAPKHKPTLRLLKQTYLHLHDWAALEILLPQLEKYEILNENSLIKLQIQIYQGLLKDASHKNPDALPLIWQRVPKSLRLSPPLLSIYAEYLSKKEPEEAESVLRLALQKQINNELLDIYSKLEGNQSDKQLQIAENWLKNHPKHAVLLLTLGRLCIKNQLWGKARSYFEASLGNAPLAVTYAELAKLMEQLGETGKALTYYRQGLVIASQEQSNSK